MGYMDSKQIEAICHSGQKETAPNLKAAAVELNETCGTVEIQLVNPKSGRDIGICRPKDIERAIADFFNAAGTSAKKAPNPNVVELKSALQKAAEFLNEADVILEREERAARLKKFPGLAREMGIA